MGKIPLIEIFNKLFVGNQTDCFYIEKPGWAVIHACKDPCHKRAVGYRGNLNKYHPNYLIKEMNTHLFLNMVDMTQTLSHAYTEPIISTALDFIGKHIIDKNILIHCNQGCSRSPALALIFLAKRKRKINNDSYQNAKADFINIFPNYLPRRGVDSYLNFYWNQLK